MELSDSEVEVDAMHKRTETAAAALVHTQEAAFAYAAGVAAAEREEV